MRGAAIVGTIAIRRAAPDVRDNALLRSRIVRAQYRYGETVREQQMMHRLRGKAPVGKTRRVMTVSIAEIRGTPGLVERRPCIDGAGQFAAHQIRVIGETVRGF